VPTCDVGKQALVDFSVPEACEQPVELLPLGLGELSEELHGMGVDRLLGPGAAPSFPPP